MAHSPGPSRLLTSSFALAIVLAAAISDVVLLRSFESLPFPRFVPPYTPQPPDAGDLFPPGEPPAPRRSEGVTVVLADGMRLDVSRQLPNYQALRLEGADVVTRALFPTFTRTGTATILTGAGPRTHGYMSNFNRRRAAVLSIGDVARQAGMITRFYSNVGRPRPFMFPDAVPAGGLAELDVDTLAQGPRPHMTLVYLRQPDLAGHRHGGVSPEYLAAARETDETLGKIRRALDLEHETLIVVTDHGHVDRGGHGGTEDSVRYIPLILAGAGIKRGVILGPEAGSDLRDVAPTVALLLGLSPPPTATGRALYEALNSPAVENRTRGPRHPAEEPLAPIFRALLGALLGLLPAALFLRRHLSRRGVVGALVLLGGLALGYGTQGYPFSFSCVNSEAEMPGFFLQLLGLSLLAASAGVLVAGDGRRFAAGAFTLPAGLAGMLLGLSGFGAPTGFEYPQAVFLAHLVLNALLAAGLVTPVACLLGLLLRPGKSLPETPLAAGDAG